ncbi:MAG: ribosome maturation factor RimP [Firmicutes bacterium HGW-Firmicutes-13]|nr:MAG: ribosome maturation factor RimP [Firmicutes bacterium HGW-Firmicutes-13]
MNTKKINDIVVEIIEPFLAENNFELVDVEFTKEGKNYYLRVFIDKPGGITLDDCKLVSEELSRSLDREEPIEQSYLLEVSSPGLERPLKKEADFERFKGRKVKIKTFTSIEGKKAFEGILKGCSEGKINIEIEEGKSLLIPYDKVAKANLVFEF